MKLLLDTHAWVWWTVGSDRLSARAKAAIKKAGAEGELLLSAISVWEVAKLVEKGRLVFDRDVESWTAKALEVPGLTLVPLTPAISCRACALPPPLHDDPADPIIVATAHAEGATVLTVDDRIRRYPHCQTLW